MLQSRPVRLVLTVQWQPRLCHRTSGSRSAQPCRLRIFRSLVPRAADERQCCHDEQQADGSPRSPHQTSQIVTYAHPDAQRRRREHQQRKQMRDEEIRELRAVGSEWWRLRVAANMQTVSTRAEYDSALLQCKSRYGLVVVDFFAPWCAGCRCMYPKLRQIAANNLDVAFIKVNTEAEEMRHLSQELGVTGLPYFNLHAGHKVQAFAANLSKVGRLRTEISALKAIASAAGAGVMQSVV